jgi:hypothetical protein
VMVAEPTHKLEQRAAGALILLDAGQTATLRAWRQMDRHRSASERNGRHISSSRSSAFRAWDL